jgi:hypothetical protein
VEIKANVLTTTTMTMKMMTTSSRRTRFYRLGECPALTTRITHPVLSIASVDDAC